MKMFLLSVTLLASMSSFAGQKQCNFVESISLGISSAKINIGEISLVYRYETGNRKLDMSNQIKYELIKSAAESKNEVCVSDSLGIDGNHYLYQAKINVKY